MLIFVVHSGIQEINMRSSQIATPPLSKSQLLLLMLFRTGKIAIHPRGSELTPEPSSGSPALYFVTHGYIKIFSTDKDGNESVQMVLGRGEIFPLIPISKLQNHSVSYQALTQVKLYELPLFTCMQNIYNNLELSNAMVEQLLTQLRMHADILESLSYKHVRERLAYRLLIFAARFGVRRHGKVCLDKPFTHRLIASAINTTRETITRELNTFRQEGLIDTVDNQICIIDVSRLHETLGKPISPYMMFMFDDKKETSVFEFFAKG